MEVNFYLKKGKTFSYNFENNNLFGSITDINGFKSRGNNAKGQINKKIMCDNEEDRFYSLLYLEDTKYDGEGNNKIPPQLLGINIERFISEGTTIGLIPQELDKDFNFLIYKVFPKIGEVSVSIYECENYPLCHLDNIDENKLIKAENIQTYFYSYNKSEWNENITPISKRQNMLLITCNKGRNENGYIYNSCAVGVNMKTEKNIISIRDFDLDNNPNMRFIREGEENKYLYKRKSDSSSNIKIFLNIKTFSGKIDINANQFPEIKEEHNNLTLYIFNGNEDLLITIKGIEDSIYLVYNYNHDEIMTDFLQVGSNYLFRYEDIVYDDYYIIFLNMQRRNQYRKYDINLFPFYLSIFPINCKFNVEIPLNKEKIFQSQNPTFIQYIGDINGINYYLKKDEQEENKSCLLYASVYQMDNKNGILMEIDSSQSFYLNHQYNNITVSYYHIKKNNNVTININSNGKTEAKYDLSIYLNDDLFSKLDIGFNKEYILTSEEIKNKCKNYFYICKITLYVEFQKNLSVNETILDIIFKEGNDNKKDDDDDDKKDDNNDDSDDNHLGLIIVCVIGSILIIFIIIVVFVILNKARQKKNMNELVNNISFKDEENTDKTENVKENRNSLLY